MQKLAIVYFPKIQLEKINEFRRKYDPNFSVIPPHITIVFPFSNIPEDKVIQHVEKVVKDIKPFSVHLKGLTKSFDNYLFLLVEEGKDKIVSLHEALYSGILASNLSTDNPFKPHMTIGFFDTKEGQLNHKLYVKAYEEAHEINFDITCKFDAISVVKGMG